MRAEYRLEPCRAALNRVQGMPFAVRRSPSVLKSKHGGMSSVFPSVSMTSTSSLFGESHPHVLKFPRCALDGAAGLSTVPPDCAAIVNRWLGNEGPFTEAKKWSPRTNSFAQCQ